MRPNLGRRRLASVQALLPLEEIAGDVVRLRGGDHRAVLEAGSVNFALKSEAEQEAILAAYRRFLNALAYPVQVLVRVVPTDVERYLDGLRVRAGGAASVGRARDGHTGDLWRRLAQDHEAFVRRIARERTLLDRRCYVVVPAGTGGAFERTGIAWPWRRSPEAAAAAAQTATAARRALAFRCAEVAQGLAACGVPTRRLASDELVALWRAALAGTPVTANGTLPPSTAVLTTPHTAPTQEATHA